MTQTDREKVQHATTQAAWGLLRMTVYLVIPAVSFAFLGNRFAFPRMAANQSDLAWMGMGFVTSWVLIIADYRRITRKQRHKQ